MLKGKAGVKQLMAESIQSRVETLLEGVVVQKFPAMYYWRPISVVGYSLALVLVLEQHAKHSMMSPLVPSAGDFLYHRLDLIQSQGDTSQCRYFGNIAIKDRSTVKFGPEAFVDPYHYLDNNESNLTVRQYSQYMNDVTTFATNPGFKLTLTSNRPAELLPWVVVRRTFVPSEDTLLYTRHPLAHLTSKPNYQQAA
ncbi:PREDICTED: VWFA and cache domain-containing protein 1-like [Priapulus caudatus]|uniref:VWFA and cache domain-containing protein 1-like n=1 Tax=Priapulus caudatus TaxID=37621 RepID=A0ABM1EXZ9_PRICU|nr:PREDICTED: VWFA and cache domain-containing protein 1-like [Priapulus caudatus]